ncbi:hypothetical protein HMPREF9628_01307 [Peptoanaerobacter stomatis]|uniref:Uncharacterized protein n=1 Tax=Peptoanaerobacter stomatis TaxID=796937 RepID=G9XBE0_9FIRM|nr:hypothetical protein [Peptoanaerobacter stomatis]EHL19791.1 hypothetical protein HMPREF9628_01307 [Peptoanaerobacter stomatis]
MIIVSDDEKKYLKKYISDIDEYIEKDDLQNFLDRIDDEIVSNILGNDDEPNSEGRKLQKIYDNIVYENRN